jgi:8-oxo-dGTP pyrophosphatase MutT (NUDIX family)
MPRRSFEPNEVSSGGVILRPHDGGMQVCLVNDGRHWGIPKGNVERGEMPLAAAIREIGEEVGIPANALRVVAELAPSDYVYRRQNRLIFKRVHQFVFHVAAGTAIVADGHEIAEAAWFDDDEARRRASFKDTVRAIDAALVSTSRPEPSGT